MNKPLLAALAAAGFLAAGPAAAHFQSIYSPDFILDGPGEVPLKLIFWHPFIEGPNVDMPLPEALYAVNRFQQIDLMPSLAETVFHGPENGAVAYDATLPVTRVGDYVVTMIGGRYFDEVAGGYIQQFAKAVFNHGGVPTDWGNATSLPFDPGGLGLDFGGGGTLPTEIVPLTKPYNVMAGSTFTGMLLREGMPLPFWEVEIVYLSAEPDMATNTVGEPTVAAPRGGMLVVTTDEDGIFTVGVPRSGFWGFGALGSGPVTSTDDGMPLSQDAILWIEAHDL